MVSRVQWLYKCVGKSKNETRPCCQNWIFSLETQYRKNLNKSVLMLTKILGCSRKNFFFQKNVFCISANPTKKTELKKLHPIKSYRLLTEKGEICFFLKHTGFCVSGEKIHLKTPLRRMAATFDWVKLFQFRFLHWKASDAFSKMTQKNLFAGAVKKVSISRCNY